MLTIWLYVLASVLVVSGVSLVGALAVSLMRQNLLRKVLIFFVSFSVGALLGGAFFHLLPEAVNELGFGRRTSVLLIAGILLFFILEKYVHWRHCHEPECGEHSRHLAAMNLVGDGVHNFLDGLIIAASYLISLPLGLTSTLAIIFHEIPQEIGDFGVLLHSGLSKKKAVFFNLLSALLAVLGAVVGLLFGRQIENLTINILPVAAAGFIYIATADLIPELHKEKKAAPLFFQLIFLVLGILIMYVMKE